MSKNDLFQSIPLPFHNTIRHWFTSTPRRISVGIGFIKLLRAGLGIYAIILSAHYFGASLERDAWVLASSAVLILSQFFFGPINETIRARYVFLSAKEGPGAAATAAASLVAVISIVCFTAIGITLARPEWIIDLFAPGYKASERTTLSAVISVYTPMILLTELVILWTALLNTYRLFYLPDLTGLVSAMITLFFLIVFAPVWGIYSLVWGTYTGTIISVFWLAWKVHTTESELLSWRISWRASWPFLTYAAPFFVAYAVAQAQLTVEKVLCSNIGVGAISVLDYAKRFIDMPISIVMGIVSTVLTPSLASIHSRGHHESFRLETLRFLRMILIGSTPLIALFLVSAEDIIAVLLVGGHFNIGDLEATAKTLQWFGVGVAAMGFYIVAGQALLAQQRATLYSVVSSAFLVACAGLATGTYQNWGVPALAMSWSLAHLAAATILYGVALGFKLRDTWWEFGRLWGLILTGAIPAFFCRTLMINQIPDAGAWPLIAVTTMTTGVGVFAALWLFSFPERKEISSMIANAIGRFRA